jgi:hypothetical protein
MIGGATSRITWAETTIPWPIRILAATWDFYLSHRYRSTENSPEKRYDGSIYLSTT